MTTFATLLVVEDDEDLREVITLSLERDGRRIAAAEDGLAALEYILNYGLPDLILLDMNMPTMNGWQLADELRERELWRVPVIVLTAAHDAERSAHEIGASGYLGKPFEIAALETVVERQLREAARPQRSEHASQ